MNNNKHVFSELVMDIDNPEHLIAYALYKNHKHNLAIGLIGEGKDPAEIETRLEQEKQNTLSNPIALQKYRDDAAIYLSKVLESTTTKLKQEYEDQRKKDKKAISDEAKKIQAQWLRKVDLQRLEDKNNKAILWWTDKFNMVLGALWKKITAGIITLILATIGFSDIPKKLMPHSQKPNATFEKNGAE